MAVEHEGPREPLEGPVAGPSAELLAALRARDPAVLPRLLETHGHELGAVAYLILRDRAEAEDVVVEALLDAVERSAGLRDGVALRTRLLRIVIDRALARRRRRSRVVPLEVVDAGGSGLGDPTQLATRATILNAVNRLPPRRRAALVLRSYAGCSVGEIAAILGLGPDGAAAELRTAVTHLRAELGPGDPLPTPPMAGPDRVAVDPLEELLERVLRQAALPVEVPPGRLAEALAERRRRAARRRSLVLVAAAAVLLGGLGAFLGTRGRDAASTPGPTGVPTSVASAAPASPTPRSAAPASALPSIAAVPSLPAVPAGRVEIDHPEAGSATGSVARRWIGYVGPAASYGVAWVCSGPGTFGVALGEEGTARLIAAPDPTPCDGRPRMVTFEILYPDNAPVYVTVDRRASWRLVVTRDPLAFSEPTPAASGAVSLDTSGAAVVVSVRTYRGAPILVVDAVGPDGDRGRVGEFAVPDIFGDADVIDALVGGVRFDGRRYLVVPVDARTFEPRSDGTEVVTDRYATFVFDLRAPGSPPRVLGELTSAAWGPDGRLAYVADGALWLLDPGTGTRSTVPIPDGVVLVESGLGDGAWLADGRGFLTARQVPDGPWTPGILTIEGRFRALDGPPPATYSPTGLPRRPAHGGEIAADCPEHAPDTACSMLVTFGPGEAPVRWWNGFGIAEWTADGRGIWVLEGAGQLGPSSEARLVRVARAGEGELVAAWVPPMPEAFASFAGIAADDSAVLIGYTEPLPELRWIDVGGRLGRRVGGSFAGWVRP